MVVVADARLRREQRSRLTRHDTHRPSVLRRGKRRRAAMDLAIGRDRGGRAARRSIDRHDVRREADPFVPLAGGHGGSVTGDRLRALMVLSVAGAIALFWLVVHQVSALWLDVALRPEVREALQRSMDDQKRLRALDDGHREEYRRQFESTRQLLQRLDVIRMSREQMLRR